jgi:hypothetical protein
LLPQERRRNFGNFCDRCFVIAVFELVKQLCDRWSDCIKLHVAVGVFADRSAAGRVEVERVSATPFPLNPLWMNLDHIPSL